MELIFAGFALLIIWLLSILLVYFGTYMASVTLRDLRYTHPLAEDSPWHHFVALLATLVWCAVTANMPLP